MIVALVASACALILTSLVTAVIAIVLLLTLPIGRR